MSHHVFTTALTRQHHGRHRGAFQSHSQFPISPQWPGKKKRLASIATTVCSLSDGIQTEFATRTPFISAGAVSPVPCRNLSKESRSGVQAAGQTQGTLVEEAREPGLHEACVRSTVIVPGWGVWEWGWAGHSEFEPRLHFWRCFEITGFWGGSAELTSMSV